MPGRAEYAARSCCAWPAHSGEQMQAGSAASRQTKFGVPLILISGHAVGEAACCPTYAESATPAGPRGDRIHRSFTETKDTGFTGCCPMNTGPCTLNDSYQLQRQCPPYLRHQIRGRMADIEPQ